MSCSTVEAVEAKLEPASSGSDNLEDPVLSALGRAIELLCAPDVLLILSSDAPPSGGIDLLKFFSGLASVVHCLVVPTSSSAWAELGWPADKICHVTDSGPELAHAELNLAKLSEVVELSVRTWPDDSHIVILDLNGADATPLAWQELRQFVTRPNGSLVRIGPRPPGVDGAIVDGVGRLVHADLEVAVALPLLGCGLAGVERASFIVLDGFYSREEPYVQRTTCGSEVVAPIDAPVSWILRRACAELGNLACDYAAEAWRVVAQAIFNPGVMVELGAKSSVPRQFFSQTREGDLLVARIVVMGAKFPGKNTQLQAREAHVRGILQEMLTAFGAEDYQSRLARVRDQLEVRDMVKAVHVEILPKHGFPISVTTRFSEAIQTQSRMQVYLFAGINGLEENQMGEATLALSGIHKLHRLPSKYKPNPVDSTQIAERIATASNTFRQYEPTSPVVYGGWLGWRRALTTFLHASADEMTDFLRADIVGPFSGKLDDWPTGATPDLQSRWQRWCFQVDAKETILKTDWHSQPRLPRGETELFVPRLARVGPVCCAPPRLLAFVEAFRTVNGGCWTSLAQALRELRKERERSGDRVWREEGGGELAEGLADCLAAHGHFGAVEVQVWWGEGPLVLPSHKDGATSLLHLSLTLGGCRVLRMGVFRSMLGHMPRVRGDATATQAAGSVRGECKEDVWDESAWCGAWKDSGTIEDVRMVRGSVYLSSPYCFEHGVRYEMGSQQEPVIALQCRFAFDPKLGKKLNGRRDDVMWDISSVIAKALQTSAESGELRMPSVEEVKQQLANLPAPAPLPVTVEAAGPASMPLQGPAGDAPPTLAPLPSAVPRGAVEPPAMLPPAPPPPQASEREREVQLGDTENDRVARERAKLAWEAAKEREKLRLKGCREKKAQVRPPVEPPPITEGEEVEVAIRHGQQRGQVVVTVPGSATMLEVKKALVRKIGRGLVRKVQLVKETGHTFAPYQDQEQLGDRRELVVLGLHLGLA